MKQLYLPVALALLLLTPSFSQAALAQQRMTSSQLEELERQVKEQYGAYQRFAMAEQDALEDGENDFAARYREAKAKAHEAYVLSNARLQQAQAQKHHQDARTEMATDYR